jgi:hypothetical protein
MSGHFFNLHIDIPADKGQSMFMGTVNAVPANPVIRPCVFMQRLMFSRLYNWFLALRSYNDLRPDMGLRRQVNRQVLATRPAHSGQEWYQKFWAPQGISSEVATFLYQALAKYSGLQLAKVQPSDRLCEDLKLPLICWFDWELAICEDFHQEFGFDLEDYFDLSQLKTVADLMGFFNQQVALAQV